MYVPWNINMFLCMNSSLSAQTVMLVFRVGGRERACDIIIHGKERELNNSKVT